MAFTVVVALLSSLIVSVFLVPVLASRLFPIYTREERPIGNRALRSLDRGIERALKGINGGYRKAVGWCLGHRAVVIILSAAALAASLVCLPKLGIMMMPPSGETSIILNMSLPEGTALWKTDEMMQQWMYIAENGLPESERSNIIVTSGSAGGFGDSSGTNSGVLEITLPPAGNRTMSDDEIKEELRSRFGLFPDAVFSFTSTDMAKAMSGSSDVSLNFAGDNIDELAETTEEFMRLVKEEVPEVLECKSSHVDALPELRLVLDRARCFDLGLDTRTVAFELRSQIAGVTATTLSLGDEHYDVVLQLRQEDRDSVPDVDKLFVSSNSGARIPFSSFGTVERDKGPVSLYRENRAKTISVSGEIASGAVVSSVQKKLETLVSERMVLPGGVSFSTGGQMEMFST